VSIFNNICKGFMGYTEKSIYGLMLSIMCYGLIWLKIGIAQQGLVEELHIAYKRKRWNLLGNSVQEKVGLCSYVNYTLLKMNIAENWISWQFY
jgi:hypothetical protein